MAIIDLRFPVEIREALRLFADGYEPERIHSVVESAEIPADADEDLAELWHSGLIAGVDADMRALVGLLSRPEFGRGAVAIPEDEAMHALRGFTVLRLALRSGPLRDVDDETLETDAVDRRRLTPAARHAYACYGILGQIQAALCDALET